MRKRLTKANKRGIPELINKLHIERAISVLYEYEETGYIPDEIRIMEKTIYNLQERIKKLEDW